MSAAAPEPRKGMPPVKLPEEEFKRRFLQQFQDPAFRAAEAELGRIAGIAWDAYARSRKSLNTRKVGPGHADPDYELSLDWIAARQAIDAARRRHDDPSRPSRVLIVNASPRSEHSCPSEMSKSWRLTKLAETALIEAGLEAEILDLSRTVSEYGRHIHPCKARFSTAAALCHWPCSCYPNHSLGQTQDWMNDIYPMWVAAHGVLIVTPVHWYQSPTPLKAMIDRLVCADMAFQAETRNAARTLAEAIMAKRAGRLAEAGTRIDDPRSK